jgi:glutamate dehydrogenase (NAD(P)+)
VTLTKLQTVPAWFIVDLDGIQCFGPVRLGPKVLQSTAKQYARAETYKLALIGKQLSGGAGGIKVDVNDREETVRSFTSELEPIAKQNIFHPDPAWGVDEQDFAALRGADPRNSIARGPGAAAALIAAGACAIAETTLSGISGASLALGAANAVHIRTAARWIEAGGTVIGVEFRGKSYTDESGIGLDELEAIARGDLGLNSAENDASGLPADVYLPNTARAAVTHTNEAAIGAKQVLGLADLSITPRGLANLSKRQVTVLPDFLATSAVTHAAHGTATSLEQALGESAEHVGAIAEQASVDQDGPFLGACRLAESFLSTWRDELPFGRPLA